MWAVIPAKNFTDAKQRLGGVLNAEERTSLFAAMFEDVLSTLVRVPGLDGVLVVTRDPAAAEIAARHGAEVLEEPENRGQTAAVQAAADWLTEKGVDGMVAVPGDVPLVPGKELEQVLAAHGRAPAMTIVPAQDERGSNCIACSPPGLIPFRFGNDSFKPHLQEASDRGVVPRILPLPGLGLDIDRPDDLAELMAAPGATRAQRWLRANGIAERLTAGEFRGMIDRRTALALAQDSDLEALMAQAAGIRDATYAGMVSYSRKVFIPLTQLCRDVCHYCTFAHPPRRGQRAYMTHEEIVSVARAGAAAGCKEALFTLGDKPELRYRVARDELAALGHETTLSYLAEVCELVFRETGILPHVNAGVMDAEDMAMLRGVSVSQGLMLESISPRLLEKGMPHYGSPDKDPETRLETIRIAGEQAVPFTTGILIGIGETRVERIESLLALRDLHNEYGHIQEVIVQNFRAKAGTKMSGAPEPSTEELLRTIAMARLLFTPDVTIQAPPNLSPGMLDRLIAAGLNDWGGVSPVTPDHVNPEAPWPHLDELAQQTAACGRTLVERLAIYPEYALSGEKWLDRRFRTPVLRLVDGEGLPRTDGWMTGTPSTPPPLWAGSLAAVDSRFADIIARAKDGADLSEADVTRLFRARGGEVVAVCEAADELRRAMNGDTVSYVVTRNINYTNVCYFKCQFCAFSKGKMSENLRGQPYDLDMDEIIRRVVEAWERGATEVCMQGGIHPEYTGETYLDICRAVKAAVPGMHVHAYSPLEVWQGARTLGIETGEFLSRLRDAGLGSLPGTAAEVLDDEVRATLCPDKVNTAQWLEVMEAAHNAGLRTTSTIMYGHVDRPVHWARHLLRLRNLQKKTGGFTEFVPLPFVAEEAPIYLKGNARRGPTFREAVLMHAVARLALHPHITNIQTSWVKMGPEGVKACLNAGANDLGGTLMNETITRAAGASYGQEMPPEKMESMIREIGRVPVQRTTFYGTPPQDQVRMSFGAAPLGDVVNTPARRYERDVKPVLYRPGLVGAAE